MRAPYPAGLAGTALAQIAGSGPVILLGRPASPMNRAAEQSEPIRSAWPSRPASAFWRVREPARGAHSGRRPVAYADEFGVVVVSAVTAAARPARVWTSSLS
jgi:hypothetical protein